MSKKAIIILLALLVAYIAILASEQQQVNLIWGLVKILLNFSFLIAIIYYLYDFFKITANQSYWPKFIPILIIIAFVAIAQTTAYYLKTDGGKNILIKKEYANNQQKQLLLIFADSSFKLLNINGKTGIYYRGTAHISSNTISLESPQNLPSLLIDLRLPLSK